MFGRKKQAEALAAAQAAHQVDLEAWQAHMAALPELQRQQDEAYEREEEERVAALAAARSEYEAECAEREHEAARLNAELDELIAGLGYGTAEAIEECVSIVLSNSVYPDAFPVEHDFGFDGVTAELSLRVLIPDPGTVPTTKAHRYNKSADAITETTLSQKQQKDRYAGAIHQIALRSLHEVFEADRRGLIRTISLELGTNAIDPATGRPIYVPFVAAAVERDAFMQIDLAEVVPALTLQHLGAAVSKKPTDLVAIDSSGVRSSRADR